MRATFLKRAGQAFGQAHFIPQSWSVITLITLLGVATNLLASPTVTTLGGGQPPHYYGYRDTATLQSLFHTPSGLAIDASGTQLLVADRDNNAIRVVDLFAGDTYTFGVTATSAINKPVGVAVDINNNVFVLDRGNGNNGMVVQFDGTFGDLIATNASGLVNAAGIALDTAGNIYVTISGNTLIRITPAGVRTTVATVAAAGTSLQGIVVKHNGLIAACDSGRNGILLINPNTGTITTNAGFHGQGDFSPIGTDASSSNSAKFYLPMNVTEAGDGTLVVTDFGNNRVKAVLNSGAVTNLEGVASNYWVTGSGKFPGWADGTVIVPDKLGDVESRQPFGVAFGPDGTIYTSEDYYHTIRQVTGTGLPLPPPQPPVAPTGLSAVATFGQVVLTWSASSGAISYNVKRSTSTGGPYATIGNTPSTTFTDTNVLNGSTYFYVVSAVNAGGEGANSLEVSATPPIPPPPSPKIGWFDYEGNNQTGFFTVNHPVSFYLAHNDLSIAVDPTTNGIATYYITGPAPLAANPSATNGSTPPFYQDGLIFAQPLPVTTVPDMIVKAVNVGPGGSSSVVTAEFQFQCSNPQINGINAALFTVSDVTSNVTVWYTTDGTTPTNAPPSVGPIAITNSNSIKISLNASTNILFQVRAFRNGYLPSGTAVQSFTPGNFLANTISFGLASGEPASHFLARPGQFFYAPVTLSLIDPSDTMYSLQFNAMVTNGLATPNKIVNGAGINFFPMLMTKVPLTEGDHFPPLDGNWYLGIPNVTFTSGTTNQPLSGTFVNTNNNLIGVSWMFRVGFIYTLVDTNLVTTLDFDTSKQDLITYSIAHDTLFNKSGGTVVLGAYSFQVPNNSSTGDKYFIQLGSPSATRDGAGATGAGIYIQPPANSQAVTVTNVSYLAGDAAPFHWLNVGDFGDGMLDSSDVQQVFQSAVLGVDMPPANSDLFLAMDSSGNLGTNDGTGIYIQSTFITNGLAQDSSLTNLFDGSNTNTIDQMAFGDGVLDVSDVYVTYRRSVDKSLTWWLRFWTNGQFVAVTTPNLASNTLTSAVVASGSNKTTKLTPALTQTNSFQQPSVTFSAGDALVTKGQTIQIPINANIFGIYPLRILALNLTVHPLDGSPALTQSVQFIPGAMGQPYTAASKSPANYTAAWWPINGIDSSTPGVTGNVNLGSLIITVPTNATSQSAYAIHFDKASGSPNGVITFPKNTYTGLITLSSRTNSAYGDGIPDSWRLRWFGTVNNYLSLSNACPSGDGISNWKKYIAGVDPSVANDFPRVNAKTPVPAGSTTAIHWPTIYGKQYVIERSPTLFSGTWTIIATNTGTGTDMEFDDNSSGTANFYRVRILP